ncbi:MAG: DUF305 domain-containing protein, partial [Acidobacteriota bacterium]|nr:DUF305 domain-containing protein [Acidobacteriota bacterium]
LPSEHLSANEIAAAALADQGVFNPQQQLRVTWPAEPVVARAYLDQLARGAALPEARAADLVAALDRAEERLTAGTLDEDLAADLESLAASLPAEAQGDALARKRRAALGDTLAGIAARLR